MIRVIHRGGPSWGIQSSCFQPILRDEARRTPGMVWDAASRSWCGYADAVAVTVKRSRSRGLVIQESNGAAPVQLLPIAQKDLRGYQVEGVHFLIAKANEGAILADEMACGKSCQAITAARAFKTKTVIVCPSFVRGVWLDEMKRWWPAARVAEVSGTKPETFLRQVKIGCPPFDFDDADVVIIHYDILYAWVPSLLTWGLKTLILDEFQYCQGGNSRRTKAATELARSSAYRIALTGTPPLEKTKNLWAAVNTISEGRFGAKPWGFYVRHCDAHQEQITPTKCVWKIDGSSNLDELQERLTWSPATHWGFMLRRLKSEVAIELPARTRQILELEVPKLGLNASIKSALGSDKLLRAALNATADGKLPQVIDIVIDHIQAGHKVVVGAYRKAIAYAIAEGVTQKIPVRLEVITGDVPLAKREAAIKSQPSLLCCTFDSTGVGIDLSFASVGVVAELDYSPVKLTQWEGRFGRKAGRNVLIQYAIAKGSADELVKRVVLQKLDRFTASVGRVDGKLAEDFAALSKEGAAARMQRLYEKLCAKDD